MELTRILATNLRVLRELRGRLGQLELAQRVGVSRRTIARLENAEVADPGVDQVRGLAAALRVPTSCRAVKAGISDSWCLSNCMEALKHVHSKRETFCPAAMCECS